MNQPRRSARGASAMPMSSVESAHRTFAALVALSEQNLVRRRYAGAAACALLAARHAFTSHSGLFASARLERVLTRLAEAAVPPPATVPVIRKAAPEHVLHVLTYGRPIGGDTRFVWRWIENDPARRHSVAITRQGGRDLPQALADAVRRTGGGLHVLQTPVPDILGQAAELRRIACAADLVVLHLFPDDVVPAIAFGTPAWSVPIVFAHHSDHTFWVGSASVDVCGQLRDTPYFALGERRGIEGERTAVLPIPLETEPRLASRADARRAIGVAPGCDLLLTVATGFKFEALPDAPGLLDLVLPLIERRPSAVLLAIGPERSGRWAEAEARTGGRVRAMGHRTDVARFYEAADLYLDSAPFSSITSLLEAGARGLPLVTYVPSADARQLLGPGAPGLDPILVRTRTPEEYDRTVAGLLAHADARSAVGERTARCIAASHTGAGWRAWLDALYARSLAAPHRVRPLPASVDVMTDDPLDARLHWLLGRLSIGLGPLIDSYVGALPYRSRLPLLCRLAAIDRSFSRSLLLPPPIERTLRGKLAWRHTLPRFASSLMSRRLTRTRASAPLGSPRPSPSSR